MCSPPCHCAHISTSYPQSWQRASAACSPDMAASMSMFVLSYIRLRHVPPPPSPTFSTGPPPYHSQDPSDECAELLKQIDRWDFDIFSLHKLSEKQPLVYIGLYLEDPPCSFLRSTQHPSPFMLQRRHEGPARPWTD